VVAIASAVLFEEVILDPLGRAAAGHPDSLGGRRLDLADSRGGARRNGRVSKEFDSMRLKDGPIGAGRFPPPSNARPHRLSTLYAIDRRGLQDPVPGRGVNVSLERVLDLMKMDAGAILLDEIRRRCGCRSSRDLAGAAGRSLARVETAQRVIGGAASTKKSPSPR